MNANLTLLLLGGAICAAFLAGDALAARDPLPGGLIPTTCAAWLADGAGAGPTIVIDGAVASRFWTCVDEPGGIRLESTP